MFRLDVSMHLDHPAAVVWTWLADFPSVPRWEDGVLEVRQVSAGPPGIGTTFRIRRAFGGRETTLDGRLVAWEDGQSATMELVGGPLRRVVATYAVAPDGPSGCIVTYRTEGRLVRSLVWLHPLVAIAGRRQVTANLARLDALIPRP